jgi:hypothetical protein
MNVLLAGATPPRRETYLFCALLVGLVFPYYAFLIDHDFKLWDHREDLGQCAQQFPLCLGLTFNSMLEHLLRGRFDVAPETVGLEGFLRDGRIYAYWGMFPALLRLPLLFIPNGLTFDVTPLSCVLATCAAATIKLLTLRQVARSTHGAADWVVALFALVIVLSGAQITFLRASLYQEVCLWAGVWAALFVYFAVRCVVRDHFDRGNLCSMAFAAGFSLNTRVSVAVGLYAGLTFLVIVLAIRSLVKLSSQRMNSQCWRNTTIVRDLLPTFLILLIFAAIAGIINFYRWGHPLVFADFSLYIYNKDFPDRLPRTETFGLFNILRVPLGLIYYFVPVWVVQRTDGKLMFEEYQTRLLDAVELPPSSFLLTDAFLVLLVAYACWILITSRELSSGDRFGLGAIGVGLGLPWLLMLTAISMNFRYRIDFYPLLEFGAFVALVLAARFKLIPSGGRAKGLLFASVALSIVASHLVYTLYILSNFGPAIGFLRQGVVHYYGSQSVGHRYLSLIFRGLEYLMKIR